MIINGNNIPELSENKRSIIKYINFEYLENQDIKIILLNTLIFREYNVI